MGTTQPSYQLYGYNAAILPTLLAQYSHPSCVSEMVSVPQLTNMYATSHNTTIEVKKSGGPCVSIQHFLVILSDLLYKKL